MRRFAAQWCGDPAEHAVNRLVADLGYAPFLSARFFGILQVDTYPWLSGSEAERVRIGQILSVSGPD